MPTQTDTFRFGTPASANVGTSGIAAERLGAVTASAFRRPLAVCGGTDAVDVKSAWIRRASRSFIAGAAPL